jgi:cell division protein FtsQ
VWNKPHVLNLLANLLFALAFLMLVYAALFLLIRTPLFPLKEIKVENHLQHVTQEQVQLIVGRYLSGNFFTVNLERTRDAFRKLPWARNVSVKRRWPNSLEVAIEEHQALARWGNVALVNNYGEMFAAASDADLPVFYGPGDSVAAMAEAYGRYQQLLQEKQQKIVELILSPRGSWQLTTESGLTIALGRENMRERLERFIKAYDTTFNSVGGKLSYVDLRYPNGFAVRKAGMLAQANTVDNPYAAQAKPVVSKAPANKAAVSKPAAQQDGNKAKGKSKSDIGKGGSKAN